VRAAPRRQRQPPAEGRPQRRDHLRAGPAGAVSAHQPPHQAKCSTRHHDEARDVERSAGAEALPRASEHERNDHEADRNIEPEDPLPSDAFGDRATRDRSGNQGKSHDATEDPQCRPTRLAWECRGKQRHRERHHQRRAGPLHGARRDQPAGAARKRARARCDHEQPEAGCEHAPAPPVVAERGGGQQQHCQAQVVGVYRPLQRLHRGAKIGAHCAQCGRDREGVESDHELRNGPQRQDPRSVGFFAAFVDHRASIRSGAVVRIAADPTTPRRTAAGRRFAVNFFDRPNPFGRAERPGEADGRSATHKDDAR